MLIVSGMSREILALVFPRCDMDTSLRSGFKKKAIDNWLIAFVAIDETFLPPYIS
jgi:hypothetical protein